MQTPPRRRWFQFGLRSLFVLVSLLAMVFGWISWQQRIIRERREILQTLNAEVRRYGDPVEFNPILFSFSIGLSRDPPNKPKPPPPPPPSRLPFWRNWLGDDDQISSIKLSWKTSDADYERVQALYPEVTTCERLPPPYPGTDGPPVKFLPEEDFLERWTKPKPEPYKSRILKSQ